MMDDTAPPDSTDDPERDIASQRLRALGLVLFVALSGTLTGLLGRLPGGPGDAIPPITAAILAVATTLAAVLLLVYVLFRQRRSLRSLGVSAVASDLPLGLAVAALGLAPFAVRDALIKGHLGVWLVSVPTTERVKLPEILIIASRSIRIGLVSSSYPITEVLEVSGSALLAVATSVGLVGLTYFAQGANAALPVATWLASGSSLLVYSIFYWRTRRATALVLGFFFQQLWLLLHAAAGGQ